METIKSTIDDCSIHELQTIERPEGDMTVIEQCFERAYFIYGIKDDARRGLHAHKTLKQIMIAVHGSFSVKLDDSHNSCVHTLNDPSKGLYINCGIWRELYDFSNDAVVLVLASEKYDETDYIRDYKEFVSFKDDYGINY